MVAKRLINILIISLFAAPHAHADWTTIVDSLLKSGLTQIGSFNVQEFRDKAEQLKLDQLSEAPPSVLSGSRQSGYYVCGKKPSANIVDHLPSEALSSADQLELHELLGALCFDDSTYALSTALVILARMNDSAERQSLAASFGKSVFAKPKRYAGGTVVSGGGDIVSLYFKSQVLELIMGDPQNRLSATGKFLVQFSTIDFEPLRAKVPQAIYLQYDFKVRGGESLAVFIPMQRWQQGPAARRALVRETAAKIREVFPAYAGQASISVRPNACGANAPTISFPLTHDRAVRGIQDVRAGLLLGCAKYGAGFTGYTVIAPYLNAPEEPRRSGNFYFNCTFTYDQGQKTNQVRSPRGVNSTNGVSWATDTGIDLTGYVSVTANGKIAWTMIASYENGQPKLTPKSPGITRGSVRGVPVSFSCEKER